MQLQGVQQCPSCSFSSAAALCQPIPLTSLKLPCTCEVRKAAGVQLGLETLILFDKHLLS